MLRCLQYSYAATLELLLPCYFYSHIYSSPSLDLLKSPHCIWKLVAQGIKLVCQCPKWPGSPKSSSEEVKWQEVQFSAAQVGAHPSPGVSIGLPCKAQEGQVSPRFATQVIFLRPLCKLLCSCWFRSPRPLKLFEQLNLSSFLSTTS